MNLDSIEKGKTGGKWAESYALFGGIGAIIFPPVFWYVAYAAVDERDDYLYCKYTKKEEEPDEDHDDYLRFAMFWNCILMVIFLALHYTLFARPDSYSRFKTVGYIFAVVCALEIAFASVNLILAGISICNGEMWGGAAIFSSLAIIAVNLFTIIGSTVYFCVKTRLPNTQVAPRAERPAAVDESVKEPVNKPEPKPAPKEEEEEDLPPPEEDDGGIE